MKIKGDFRWLMDAFRTREGAERVLMKLGRGMAGPMRRPVVDGGTLTFVPIDKRQAGVRRRLAPPALDREVAKRANGRSQEGCGKETEG